jgi:hypothetical protein
MESHEGQQREGPPEGSSEEELRARIEQQLQKLRVQDLMVESVASVLNLTARRIAKPDERDLEQARVGIEAVRAWVDLLPGDVAKHIRDALSELQMLYAKEAEGAGASPAGEAEGETPPEKAAEGRPPPRRGSKPPPRLWTPPGSE